MNLIKKHYPLLLLLLLPATMMAQKEKAPKWVDFYARQSMYPDAKYVVGFASDEFDKHTDKKEMEEQLHHDARTELIESIQVSIQSMTTAKVVTSNTETYNSFRRTSVSLAKIDLQGLKTEKFINEKDGQAFYLTYAEKAKISESYRNRILNKKAKLEQLIQHAETHKVQHDNQNALKNYYACLPVFREIEEAQTLIMTFESTTTQAEHLHFKAINELKLKVNQGIKSLQTNENLSIDDAAYVLAMGLKYQSDSISKEIRLNNFTYQDTKMASTFSNRFTRSLESKLAANKFDVSIQQPQVFSNSTSASYYNMLGTYWEEGDKIKLIANIRDAATGKTVASSEANLSKAWLETNKIDIKPNNYNNAIQKQVQLNKPTISTGGLLVDISTNKGSDGLIFTEDEEMKIYVRTNKACYIRLIYHLADGQQVLLFDNYYISNKHANQVIEIPETFVCSAPFGVETLQLNAQTAEFPPLITSSQYGYDFIQESLKKVLFKNRGFKPKNKLDAKTEKRLIITTMK